MNAFRTWICLVALMSGLLAACGGGGSDPVVPARAGSADITAGGGTVDAVLEGGTTVRLEVPAGALAATTTFRIDPAAAPGGTLGAFTLSPAGTALLKPVTLTMVVPAGQPPNPDTSLLIDTGSRKIPLGQAIDPTTRTLTVQLDAVVLAASTGALAAAPARPQAFAASTTSGGVSIFLLQILDYPARLTILEQVVSDLASQGSNKNAVVVHEVMDAVLGDPRGSTEPRVHAVTPTWRNVVCGQQQFSTSALDTFASVDIQTFEQRAKDVVIWNRHALDLNALDARMSPPEPGCAGVPADLLDPVRARLPTFLADVRQALDLLDPSVAADYAQLFGVRFADMLNLASDFGLIGASDLEGATFGVILSELVRVRGVAYSECRVHRDQSVQAKLLTEALLDESRSPFKRENVLEDVQFCGMPLHWKLFDAQGALLQQGDAGGIGPGVIDAVVVLPMAGAARLQLSGPLAALHCPVGSQNNEQLDFSAGPIAGPFASVGVLSASNTLGYLESSAQDFDLATLLGQGVLRIKVARLGGLCNGEFVGLAAHATIANFALDFGLLQVSTASLPAGTVGAAYSTPVAATGGRAPLGWLATGLPAGLTIDAQTGVISGTPSAAATSTVLIGVTSADGQSAQRSVSLTVAAPTTYVGGMKQTNTFHAQGSGSSLADFDITATKSLEFSNVTLVLQPDGSFKATGTLLYIERQEKTFRADGCRVTISIVGSGPVTSYDGKMPASPGGILKGNVTFTRVDTVEPCPSRGEPGDSLASGGTNTGMSIERPATPVFAAGNLVELNWNLTLTGDTNITTLVGSIKLAP